MSSMVRMSVTRAAAWARSSPSCSGPKASSSRTVGEKTWASLFWNTKPIRDRKAVFICSSSRVSSVIGSPKAVNVPVVGNTNPFNTLSRVDLPEPFAPSRASFSPRATVRSTPPRAGNRSR